MNKEEINAAQEKEWQIIEAYEKKGPHFTHNMRTTGAWTYQWSACCHCGASPGDTKKMLLAPCRGKKGNH